MFLADRWTVRGTDGQTDRQTGGEKDRNDKANIRISRFSQF